jgi:hypothetical protein
MNIKINKEFANSKASTLAEWRDPDSTYRTQHDTSVWELFPTTHSKCTVNTHSLLGRHAQNDTATRNTLLQQAALLFSFTGHTLAAAEQPTGRWSLRVETSLNWLMTYLLTHSRLAPSTFCFFSCHSSAPNGYDSAEVWTWQLKRIFFRQKHWKFKFPPQQSSVLAPCVCFSLVCLFETAT